MFNRMAVCLDARTQLKLAELKSSFAKSIQSTAMDLREGACLCAQRESGFRYLLTTEYPLWDSLVDVSPQGSVFCRSWWLNALGDSVRVLGYFRDGRLVAGIPLYFERRMGITVCTMPKLTQVLGVVIEPTTAKTESVLSREMDILSIFARYLSKERLFFQAFHPSLQNWLPFYWNGFRQTSRVTYILDDLQSLDSVWAAMHRNIRCEIKKAQKLGIVISPCGAECIFETISKTFCRQHLRLPYSQQYFSSLFNAATQNNTGAGFAARDREGRVHAAAFLIWDHKAAYYLAGGGDPALRSSGATSLLVWNLIQFAARCSTRFDFEGSVIQSVERFFRSFGARQTPYNHITKFPAWARVGLTLSGKI
jgi:Acetyltransferase (GNAT) domain